MLVNHPALRVTALALLLSTAAAIPAFAAPSGQEPASEGPPSSTLNVNSSGQIVSETPDTSETPPAMNNPNAPYAAPQAEQAQQGSMHPGYHHAMMTHGNGAAMKQEVESRIKTLHAKLRITPNEEGAWNDVAQAMRDNEATISGLIHERHHSAANMTALDDLQSYQQISQAHADGLKKVTAAFTPLYESMPDAQRANADKVFSGFEGHGAIHHIAKKSQ